MVTTMQYVRVVYSVGNLFDVQQREVMCNNTTLEHGLTLVVRTPVTI